MPDATLTKTRIAEGRWHGVLTGGPATPDLLLVCQDRMLEGLEVRPAADGVGHEVSAPIPPELITDGVVTFLVQDRASGATLASFALMAGEAMAEDIRAEIDLLRAELDMLKRAFRRHCLETA